MVINRSFGGPKKLQFVAYGQFVLVQKGASRLRLYDVLYSYEGPKKLQLVAYGQIVLVQKGIYGYMMYYTAENTKGRICEHKK